MSKEHTSKCQKCPHCSWEFWNSRSLTVESEWGKYPKSRSGLSRGQAS